jgi:NAD-dependent DNA ligase
MGKELIKVEVERENLQQKWGITIQAITWQCAYKY